MRNYRKKTFEKNLANHFTEIFIKTPINNHKIFDFIRVYNEKMTWSK